MTGGEKKWGFWSAGTVLVLNGDGAYPGVFTMWYNSSITHTAITQLLQIYYDVNINMYI